MPTATVLSMRRCLPALLALLLAVPMGAEARETSSTRETSLAGRIQKHLGKAGLKAGRYGVVVMTRGDRPRVVYVYDSSRPLVPASAAKILTAATALDVLGPSFRFRTRVTARGQAVEEGVLEGDLVVHGGADPNLSGRFHGGKPLAVLDALAARVRGAGIAHVTGALVLDDGPIDRSYVHPDWSKADLRRWYGAPVSGLSFNDNCIDVTLTGATPGRPARVSLPATAGPWRVVNKVKTVGGRTGAGGRWTKGGKVLELYGRVAPGKRTSFHVPVQDPTRFFGGAFLRALEKRGVRVAGGIRVARDREDRRSGRLVADHESELPPTLAVINRHSQNFYAAMLFKTCGAFAEGRGTWESGASATRAMLERRRVADGGGLILRDGSGLSVKNRISAGTLAQVLSAFDRDILRGPLLYDSLAVSGRSGTLKKRMRARGVAGRVHAKTGTLNDTRARALAGYVDGTKGHPGYVFAILLNGPGASHGVIDNIVWELCR